MPFLYKKVIFDSNCLEMTHSTLEAWRKSKHREIRMTQEINYTKKYMHDSETVITVKKP